MLVYGDHEEEIAPADRIGALAKSNGVYLDHDALRTRFIELSGIVQAIADVDFRSCGQDRVRDTEEVLLQQLTELGASLMRSWDLGCAGDVAPSIEAPDDLPSRAVVRVPEGYAFYALYPESFGLAARKLKLVRPARVIGLRSIGTGLAAIAAAALGAPPPVTLRPTGDPFARELRINGELSARVLKGEPHFVIVDEGPGFSGSSFGCVADWLERHGVPPDRISFLPGHEGDLGAEANERHRCRWRSTERAVARIESVREWVEQLLGPIESWRDLSAGGWRPLWTASEADWPAVTPTWERAKFLVGSGGNSWLVRFAGLGEIGRRKLAIARALERAGSGPETAGLAHGWLIQRWYPEAEPAKPTLPELVSYLRLRSFLPAHQGASLSALVTMVRRNVPQLAAWTPQIEALQRCVRPVRIDGRLQAHEWLRLPTGRLLKADAVDHHQAHDLIGCQDIAWDVAAAKIELHLTPDEVRALELALGVDPRLTCFYRVAYAAFRLGAHRISEGMVSPEEAARHRQAAERYELALVDAVEHAGDIDQALGLQVEALA